MSIRQVGIKVIFRSLQAQADPRGGSLADLVAPSGRGTLVPEPWIERGTYLPSVTLAFG